MRRPLCDTRQGSWEAMRHSHPCVVRNCCQINERRANGIITGSGQATLLSFFSVLVALSSGEVYGPSMLDADSLIFPIFYVIHLFTNIYVCYEYVFVFSYLLVCIA